MEGEVLKNCPKKSAESFILDALSNSDNFFLKPQLRTHSGTVPGTSPNIDVENRETTGEHFQNNTHSEVELPACWSNNSIDSDSEKISQNCIFLREMLTLYVEDEGMQNFTSAEVLLAPGKL